MAQTEAAEAGRAMAQALAGVFQLRPGASVPEFMALGMLFAQYDGYRDVKVAFPYIQAFADTMAFHMPPEPKLIPESRVPAPGEAPGEAPQ